MGLLSPSCSIIAFLYVIKELSYGMASLQEFFFFFFRQKH